MYARSLRAGFEVLHSIQRRQCYRRFTHVNQSRDCTFFDFPSTEFSALGKVPLFSIQQSTNLQLPEEKSLDSQVLHLLRDLVYFSQYLCIKDKMVTVNNGIRIHGVCNGIVE